MEYEYDNESDGLYIWFVDDIDKESEKYDKEIWPEELKNEIGYYLILMENFWVWKLCLLQNILMKRD